MPMRALLLAVHLAVHLTLLPAFLFAFIGGGAGKKADIQGRIKQLKTQIEDIKAEIHSLKTYSFLVGAVDPFIVLPFCVVGKKSAFSPATGDFCIVAHNSNIDATDGWWTYAKSKGGLLPTVAVSQALAEAALELVGMAERALALIDQVRERDAPVNDASSVVLETAMNDANAEAATGRTAGRRRRSPCPARRRRAPSGAR